MPDQHSVKALIFAKKFLYCSGTFMINLIAPLMSFTDGSTDGHQLIVFINPSA